MTIYVALSSKVSHNQSSTTLDVYLRIAMDLRES